MDKNSVSTSVIIECALFAAISSVIFLTLVIAPALGIILVDVSPIPIIISAFRHGLKHAVIATLSATLVIMLFSGYEFAFFYLLSFGIWGFLIGVSLKKKHSASITLLIGTLVNVAVLFFFYYGAHWFSQLSEILISEQLINTMFGWIQSGAAQTWSMMKGLNLISAREYELNMANMNAQVEYVRMMIPSLLISISFLHTGFIYLVSVYTLKRLRLIEAAIKFSDWKLRWYWLMPLAGSMLYPFTNTSPVLYKILLNMNWCLYILFLFYSLAIVSSYLVYYKKGYIVKSIVYSLCLIPVGGLCPITLLGIADTLVDLRKYQRRPDESNIK